MVSGMQTYRCCLALRFRRGRLNADAYNILATQDHQTQRPLLFLGGERFVVIIIIVFILVSLSTGALRRVTMRDFLFLVGLGSLPLF